MLVLIRPPASWGRRRDCLLFWLAVAITFDGLNPVDSRSGHREQPPCAVASAGDIRDFAGQEAAAERAVGDKADAKLLTERQDLGFDVARPQRILDLHGAERVGGVGSPDCRGARFA